MLQHLLWLVIGPSMLLPQTFPKQLVFGFHLADVLDVLGFILYSSHFPLRPALPEGY